MKPFDYYAPRTLPEALDLLARHNGRARVLAGGTNLLLNMKVGTAAPRAVINIKRIPELRGVSLNYHLSIGALTTLEELHTSPIIRGSFPALSDAAATMASVQVRNLATVGGNLCNAAPSADLAPILLALDAAVRIAGLHGERRMPLHEFFTGPGATVLTPGEILVAVEVPPAAGPAIYLKHTPRACMDIAVVGVAAALRLVDDVCQAARIALGAVAPIPWRARAAEAELIDQPATPDRIGRAARTAAEEARPIDDVRGSAWYRRHMVEVLVRRGLNSLIQSERGRPSVA